MNRFVALFLSVFLCASLYAVEYKAVKGKASWYGEAFHGKQMSNGKPFDMNRHTVAHRKLPLGTWVWVMNLENGNSCWAKVTDRGPYIDGRILDVSKRVAERLGMIERGVVNVCIIWREM